MSESTTPPGPTAAATTAIALAIVFLLVIAAMVVLAEEDPEGLTAGPQASASPSEAVEDVAAQGSEAASTSPTPTPASPPSEAGATPAPPPTIGEGTGADGEGSVTGVLPTEAGASSGAALPAGTCLTDTSRPTNVDSVTPIDCAAEHTGEVYVSLVLTQPADAPYPGQDAFEAEAQQLCRGPAFEAFVGTPFATSRFFTYALLPTEESWAAGDRDVACVLYDVVGPMTGTMQGSAR